MDIVDPKIPNEKPRRAVSSPMLQVSIAVACALLVVQAVDWATAVHVLLAVLTVCTSANRAAANRRCAHCGHHR